MYIDRIAEQHLYMQEKLLECAAEQLYYQDYARWEGGPSWDEIDDLTRDFYLNEAVIWMTNRDNK